jgi:predicted amino acid racemase
VFLSNLIEQNPTFAAAVIDLHQAGDLPPDCYVIDIDTMAANSELICGEAHRHGLEVIAMTKQFGRHPAALETLRRTGVDSFVAVDMTCARAIHRAGQPLGHIGHLVQVPTRLAEEAVAMRPQNWTVVSTAKAEQAASAAAAAGTEQALLARIFGASDVVVDSHAGGFNAAELLATADSIDALDGGAFAGVTSYPALIFDRDEHVVIPTPNLATLEHARKELETAGWQDVRVNAPGETSTKVVSTLASAGVTQIEPGHGFTATGAYHAFADLPERPAMVYLSEVSHTDGDTSFCFGGGLYLCVGSVDYTPTAIVGSTFDEAVAHRVDATLSQQHQEIDFYGRLAAPESGQLNVGDSVVFCFRAQAFYTRSLVAAVAGVHAGTPTITGICTVDGRPA